MVNELAQSNKSLELYYLKTNSKDNTTVDEEVYNFSMTEEQVLEALFLRMGHRFTKSEREYYKQMTGHPLDMSHKDMVHGNAAPTSLVKKYLKLHLQDPIKFPTPFEYEKLNILDQRDVQNDSEEEHENDSNGYKDEQQSPIQINFTNFSLLPVLTGGVLNKDGMIKGTPLVPDTGSMANVISMHALKNIGFEECDVDTSVTFDISTATGISRSKGVINLTLFIKALDDKFYKISEKFIVVEYEGLTKVLIGIHSLKRLKAQWNLAEEAQNEYIILNCRSPEGKSVRKKFPTSNAFSVVTLHHVEHNGLSAYMCDQFPTGNEQRIKLQTGMKDFDKKLQDANCNWSFEISQTSHPQWGNYPTRANFVLNTDVKFSATSPEQAMLIIQNDYESNNVEEQISPVDKLRQEQPEKSLFNEIDEKLLDKIAIPKLEALKDTEKETGEVKLPNVDHLPPEERSRYKELFHEYRDVFAQSKMKFGTMKVPEIKFAFDRNDPACDPVRKYNDEETTLIQEYVDQLLEANVIRETSCDQRFNHNLMLVASNVSAQDRKMRMTMADEVSREERLNALRKNSRVVADLRSLNKKVKNPFGVMELPKFNDMLPHFRDSLLSGVDISKGFWTLKVHESCQEAFAFFFNGRHYTWVSLPMGFVLAAQIFSASVRSIYSKEAFQIHQKQHREIQHLAYNRTFKIYLDDINFANAPWCYKAHYHLWVFVLKQSRKYGVKLHPGKTFVANEQVEILGYGINTHKNFYHITSERAEYFKNLTPPLTRKKIISLLAIWNYFASLVPSLKTLTILLQLAAKNKNCRITIDHIKEFFMVKLLLCLKLQFSLPSDTKPIILCADSGHCSGGGVVMQYLPKRNYKEYPNQTTQRVPNTGYDLENVDEYELAIISCYSKTYPATDLLQSVALKELFNCIYFLMSCEDLISRCRAPVFLYTDAAFIPLLMKLKGTNSRLHQYSMYLTSFPNLIVQHSKGRYYTALCDFLSKCNVEDTIAGSFGIPAKYLENLPSFKLEEGTTFSGESLYRLMTSAVPEDYCPMALRRVVKFEHLPRPDQLERAMQEYPPEESLMRLCFGGSKVINMKDRVFIKPNNKLMSPTELKAVDKAHQLDQIRQACVHLETHYNNVNTMTTTQEIIKNFCTKLHEYLVNSNGMDLHRALFMALDQILLLSEINFEELSEVLRLYYASSLSNQDATFHYCVTKFVLLTVNASTKVNINVEQDKLNLQALENIIIQPKGMHAIDLNLFVHANIILEEVPHWPAYLVSHLAVRQIGNTIRYCSLLIFNENDEEITIKSGEPVVILNPVVENCCELDSQVVYVVERIPDDPFDQKTKTEILMQTYFMSFLGETIGCNHHGGEEDDLTTLLQGEHPLEKPDPPTVSDACSNSIKCHQTCLANLQVLSNTVEQNALQRMVAMSHYLRNGCHISRESIIKLQQGDPEVNRLRIIARKSQDQQNQNSSVQDKITLLDDVLYAVVKSKEKKFYKLYISEPVLAFLASSLHQNGFHFNAHTMAAYLGGSFAHPHFMRIISQAGHDCAACSFSKGARKLNYVKQPKPARIGENFVVDFIENLSVGAGNLVYVGVVVEEVTTMVYAKAVKSLTADNAIAVVLGAMSAMGLPARVRSDFGSCFSSAKFQEFLESMNIEHNKSVPRRPTASGSAEQAVKQYRALLTTLLLDSSPQNRGKWTKLIDFTTLVYNSACPYAKEGINLSRYSLYFHAQRHGNEVLSTTPMSSDHQNDMHETLRELREVRRSKYSDKPNPYRQGQLVKAPLQKKDFSAHPQGSGLHPTSHEIFQVQETSPTGCRLKSLLTGDTITKDIGLLRPLQAKDLIGTLGLINFKKGSFADNLYRRGSQIPLLPRSLPSTINNTPAILVQQDDGAPENTSNITTRQQSQLHHVHNTDNSLTPSQLPHSPVSNSQIASQTLQSSADHDNDSPILAGGSPHVIKVAYDKRNSNVVDMHRKSKTRVHDKTTNQVVKPSEIIRTPLVSRYNLRNRKIFNINIKTVTFKQTAECLVFDNRDSVSELQNCPIAKNELKSSQDTPQYKTKIKLFGAESVKCWNTLLVPNHSSKTSRDLFNGFNN